MDDRSTQFFRVGVVVAGAMTILAIMIALFAGGFSLWRGTYKVNVNFAEAPGVATDTPVRKSGIRIGRVSDVRFKETGEGVIVTVTIDSQYKVRRNEVCRISASLLGDATLQFVPGHKPGASTELVKDGEYMEGQSGGTALDAIGNLEGDLAKAIQSVSTAGDEIGKLAHTVNKFLAANDGKISRIVDQADRTLGAFERTLNSVNDIVGDEQVSADLRKAFSELPDFLRETRKAVEGLNVAVQAAGKNLRNLEGFTGPLGEKGMEVVDNINRAMTRLDESLAQFSRFGRSLNESRGSLGQLVNSPELYDRLARAADNVEQLTIELKPIVRDARLFASKIAAHPETLGVRGAIKPSSGIK